MRAAIYIIMCSVALLLASCGRQHNAESTVKDFMEENLKEPSTLSDVSFNGIDSTRYLNDSIVSAIRQNAQSTATQYKSGIEYGNGSIGKSLVTVRVNYTVGGAVYTDTYYLDKELSRVVAFKSAEKWDETE